MGHCSHVSVVRRSTLFEQLGGSHEMVKGIFGRTICVKIASWVGSCMKTDLVCTGFACDSRQKWGGESSSWKCGFSKTGL